MRHLYPIATAVCAICVVARPAIAADVIFSTGSADGRIATASGPTPGAATETETADDFVVGQRTQLTGGSFTGLVPTGSSVSDGSDIDIAFYRVFPADSANPSSANVPTRVNSPSDEEFASRDTMLGDLSFTTTLLDPSFVVTNSIVTGINGTPNQTTGGEGAVMGQAVRFDFAFATALTIDPGQYFFRPEVRLRDGNFLWLSAAKPIVAPGTPFVPDLQSWIRNGSIAPGWLRIGTDVTNQGPFNAVFELTGTIVPEPATWAMMVIGFGFIGATMRRREPRITV